MGVDPSDIAPPFLAGCLAQLGGKLREVLAFSGLFRHVAQFILGAVARLINLLHVQSAAGCEVVGIRLIHFAQFLFVEVFLIRDFDKLFCQGRVAHFRHHFSLGHTGVFKRFFKLGADTFLQFVAVGRYFGIGQRHALTARFRGDGGLFRPVLLDEAGHFHARGFVGVGASAQREGCLHTLVDVFCGEGTVINLCALLGHGGGQGSRGTEAFGHLGRERRYLLGRKGRGELVAIGVEIGRGRRLGGVRHHRSAGGGRNAGSGRTSRDNRRRRRRLPCVNCRPDFRRKLGQGRRNAGAGAAIGCLVEGAQPSAGVGNGDLRTGPLDGEGRGAGGGRIGWGGRAGYCAGGRFRVIHHDTGFGGSRGGGGGIVRHGRRQLSGGRGVASRWGDGGIAVQRWQFHLRIH